MINTNLIKLYSKNKQSLKNFRELLKKLNSNKKTENITFVLKPVKRKRKKISILKSPHVNKSAQKQFQTITYSSIIEYSTWEIKKNFVLLKKIKNSLFPDVKMKIEQTIFGKKTKFLQNNRFLPKTVYYYHTKKTLLDEKKKLLTANKQIKEKKVLLEKTLEFLRLLDNYGNLQ